MQDSLFQPASKSSHPMVSERAKQSNDPIKRCRSLNFSYIAFKLRLIGGINTARKPVKSSINEANNRISVTDAIITSGFG